MPKAEAVACVSIVLFPILALAICLFWNWKAGTFTYQKRKRLALEKFQASILEMVEESTFKDSAELFEEIE